jgi:hypothetical protein
MRKLMMSGAILLVAGLVQAGSVPELFNYQGRLTDESGAPLATGDYALRFEVWSDSVAGTRVWGPLCFDLDVGETPSDGHKFKVPVVQGYFNVVLDKDTGYEDCTTDTLEDPPAPVTDAFLESSRYVEIAIWNDGTGAWESILPRQQVLSAPYAVNADRSQEVVSGVGESTRIAYQTVSESMINVVTVDGTGVDVTGDLTVSGNLQAASATVLTDLTVTEDLTVTQNLTFGGSFLGARSDEIEAFSDAATLGARNGYVENMLILNNVEALTDGLLVATIHTESQDSIAAVWGEARATTDCPDEVNLAGDGGWKVGASITAVSGEDHFTRVNSFLLPVRKGDYMCIYYTQESGTNQVAHIFLQAYFWPLGNP